jgi:hypothetical protein
MRNPNQRPIKSLRDFRFMKSKALCLFLLSLCLGPHFILPNYAQSIEPETNSWSSEFLGRINDSIGDSWDEAGQRLSTSLFESITEQEFFKRKVVGDLKASVQVQRKVYDNKDIMDSWTVIDIMRVPFHLPIPLLPEDLNISGGAFGLKMAINFNGVAYNIRQIKPDNLNKLITTGQIKEKLKEAKATGEQIVAINDEGQPHQENLDLDNENQDDGDSDDDSLIDGLSEFAFWSKSNPKNRARYSKLWKLLTHPLAIPLTEESFHRYPIGDISSYGVEGAVQLGASIGWDDFNVSGIDSTTLGAGVSTYIKGEFRISILKEDQDHAQVKLTKVKNIGQSITVGQAKLEKEIFEGFIILGSTILKIKEEIIPFSLVLNRNQAEQFDISYRYDFNNPTAVKAYENAVLGRFKMSETLALDNQSGVERTFERKQDRISHTIKNKVKLSLLFESGNSSTFATTKAIISLGDEKHHLFSSENIQYQGYDTLWGHSEKKEHSFITSVILDDPNQFVPERVSLRIEGRIEDDHTTIKELRKYYSEVETALQKELLFPRPPAYNLEIPCDKLQEFHKSKYVIKQCEEEDPKKEEMTEFGEVSFYYQLDLNYQQLELIRETDKKDMWKALEQAYEVNDGKWSSKTKRSLHFLLNSPITLINLPIYLANLNIPQGSKLLSAIKFFTAWKNLKHIRDPEEFVTAFGKLFNTVYFSAEIVKAIRILTAHERVPYFYTAKSDHLWGQMSSTGESMGNSIPLIQRSRDIIDFDKAGPRPNTDPLAHIEKLSLKKISSTQIKLFFDLAETPEYVYLRIDRSPTWGRYKNMMKVMILNQGEFKKGHNEIIVDIENDTGFLKRLAKNLFNGSYSTLMASYSVRNQRFGPVKSTFFEFEYSPNTEGNEEP